MTRQEQLTVIRGLLDGEPVVPFRGSTNLGGLTRDHFDDQRLRTLWAIASSFAEVNAVPSRQRLITVWQRITGENEHQLDRLLDEVYAA